MTHELISLDIVLLLGRLDVSQHTHTHTWPRQGFPQTGVRRQDSPRVHPDVLSLAQSHAP